MKHTVKKTAYTLFFLLITLITVIYFVLNSETFQNWLTARITGYLGSRFKTTISIGHINYHPFTRFTLDDVYWGDQKNDTLFYVEHLTFNLGSFKLDSVKLSLNDVNVKGGYCKIVTYPDGTYNIDVLSNISDPNDTIPNPNAKKFKLYFDKITLTDSRFRLIDSTKVFEKEGFDGFYQDIHQIKFAGNHFWIIEDSLNFDLKNLSCEERSGIQIKNLSSKIIIGKTGIRANELDLSTAYSHITKRYEMIYNGWGELGDYYNKVHMVADLRNAKVDMRDIAFFAPYFKRNMQVFLVDGKLEGTVNNIRAKNIAVEFGDKSRFAGDIDLKGLPDIKETFMDVKAVDAVTNRSDLEYLTGTALPVELSRLGNMKFKGHYTGFYNDFVAFGQFNTNLGEIHSDINMKLNQKDSEPSYSGNIQLMDFDLGAMFNMRKYIGRSSLTASISGQGFDLKSHQSKFKSTVSYLFANGYNYQNININGNIHKKIFEGSLTMNDPNAKLAFNGTVDLRSEMRKFRFNASIKNADLQALKLYHSNNIFSTKIDIDFAFKDIDNNSGSILFNDILFVTDSANHPVKEIKAIANNEGDNKLIKIKSEVFDVEMKGNFALADMADHFKNIIYSVFPDYFKPVKRKLLEEDFTYKINIVNSDFISDVFFPQLRVYDMNVEGKMVSGKKDFSLNAFVSTLKYKKLTVKNFGIKSEINDGIRGRILTGVDETLYNDTVILKDFAMLTNIKKNEASNHIKISDTSGIVHADILTDLNFSEGKIDLTFKESVINYRKTAFDITDSSLITVSDSNLLCQNFKVVQGRSVLLINGFYDFNDVHNLRADAKNIDLALLNVFYPKLNVQVAGDLNGSFVLQGNNHKSYLNTFARVDHLSLDKDTLGDFNINSNFTEKEQRILIYAKSLNGKLKNFEAGGFISTANDEQINIDVSLNESDINFLQSVLREYVWFNSGMVSAKCKITGTISKPLINGEVDFSKMDIRVEFLKTRYKFNSHIDFDNDAIKVKNFEVTDEYGKTGIVGGNVFHKSFSDLDFDLVASRLNHFHLLNTTAKDNSLFYGTAFGSGSVNLSGSLDDLLLETDLTTRSGTVIYIPLSGSSESGEGGFINFVNKDTAVNVFLTRTNTLLGFQLSIVVHATPDAEFNLIIDEQKGDNIKGRGAGTVKLELSKQGVFNMYGQVTIHEGEYRFTASNLFTKKFILLRGGTLAWSGSPMQAQMDIQGMYTLRKVSIAELVPSASTGNALDTKIPVECLLFVKGSLSAPEIKFDLNFPDLQTSVGTNNVTEIQNVVRTLRAEPDLMNQQVMSLMLFGKFVPISGYNANSSSNYLSGAATTLSDLVTAQANNLVGNIIPGLDFNLDYQTGTDISKNRAIVSASKKFYNNRLEVQTSYDPQYANNANITTQYSISKDGNLKINAYNRNTTDPIYRTNAVTQGIGLYYRKEFDTFIELFSRKNAK